MDHVWCAPANRNLCDVTFEVVNPLLWCSFTKTGISPKLEFLIFLPTLKLLRPHMFLVVFWSEQRFQFFQNLWGSGLSKLERQHHMNTYCVTEGCKVECPRSLCFKTMWAGKKSFKEFQGRSNVWVRQCWIHSKHLRSFRRKILYLMNYTLYRDATAFGRCLPSS